MKYLLFYFLFNTLSHYEGNTPKVLSENDIHHVQCYNYTIKNGEVLKDSFLMVERRFNAEGHPLEISIYEKDGSVRSLYEYAYKQDSILMERKTYRGNRDSLVEIHEPIYNKKGQRTGSHNAHADGAPKLLNTATKYNRKGQVKKTIWREKGKSILQESYTYRLDGKLMTVQTKQKRADNFKIYYNHEGQRTHVYQLANKRKYLIQKLDYNEKGQLSETHSHTYRKMYIIGVGGNYILKKGDKISRTITYHSNGTIKEEQEYINKKLFAVKRYFYE